MFALNRLMSFLFEILFAISMVLVVQAEVINLASDSPRPTKAVLPHKNGTSPSLYNLKPTATEAEILCVVPLMPLPKDRGLRAGGSVSLQGGRPLIKQRKRDLIHSPGVNFKCMNNRNATVLPDSSHT